MTGKTTYFRFYLLAILLSFSFGLQAKKVSKTIAEKVAHHWMIQHQYNEEFSFAVKQIQTLSLNNTEVLHVIHYQSGGFALISADDRLEPVLGFSSTNTFDLEEAHPSFIALIDFYKSNAIEKLNTLPDEPHGEWQTLLAKTHKIYNAEEQVLPLIQTTWNQSGAYNKYTPDNTPAGCVAVAMAQIMKYWEHPRVGKGTHTYTHREYGTFSANFAKDTFRWEEMPLHNPTDEIAHMLFHLGISVNMNYGPGGSGASVSRVNTALRTFFDYSGRKARMIAKGNFMDIELFKRIIKNELVNGRPIEYAGYGNGSGHAFNLDGWIGEYFHFNWGWGGSSDGYYKLNDLTPGSSNWNSGQQALIGVEPNDTLITDRPFNLFVLPGNRQVDLKWEAIKDDNFLNYNIYRNDELLTTTTEETYTDFDCINDNTYYYEVTAVYEGDYAGESFPTPSQIAIPSNTRIPYQQDFEQDSLGWACQHDSTGFQYGTAKELKLGNSEDNKFYGINSGAGGDAHVTDYLVSNALDFSNYTWAAIEFDYFLRQWQNIDHLYVMYRDFEEGEWIQIAELDATGAWESWTHYSVYIPRMGMTEQTQIAFFYDDQNDVGYGAGIDNIHIYPVYDPGRPNFEVDNAAICKTESVVVTDLSEGKKDSYFWDFGSGAEPATATTAGPHTVNYSFRGKKTIKLVLNGLDERIITDILEVHNSSESKFSFTINADEVKFRGLSSYASYYNWDFGDGNTSSEEDPIHIYENPGTYTVTLIAGNGVCPNDTISKDLTIQTSSIVKSEGEPLISIYPNPVNEELFIQLINKKTGTYRVQVQDINGRLLSDREYEVFGTKNQLSIDMSPYRKGNYLIRVLHANESFSKIIIKK